MKLPRIRMLTYSATSCVRGVCSTWIYKMLTRRVKSCYINIAAAVASSFFRIIIFVWSWISCTYGKQKQQQIPFYNREKERRKTNENNANRFFELGCCGASATLCLRFRIFGRHNEYALSTMHKNKNYKIFGTSVCVTQAKVNCHMWFLS